MICFTAGALLGSPSDGPSEDTAHLSCLTDYYLALSPALRVSSLSHPLVTLLTRPVSWDWILF